MPTRAGAVPLPSVDTVAATARDAAYVAIGFGVLGFQQAQVRRRELERRWAPLGRSLRDLAAIMPCPLRRS